MKPTGLKKIKLQPVNAKTQHLCWVFEVPEAGVEQSPFLQGFTGLSTMPGPTSGPIPIVDDSTAGMKTRALEDLQRAWKALRRLEDLADSPADSKAAGRAVAFVDKAFAELEGSNP